MSTHRNLTVYLSYRKHLISAHIELTWKKNAHSGRKQDCVTQISALYANATKKKYQSFGKESNQSQLSDLEKALASVHHQRIIKCKDSTNSKKFMML